MLVPGRWDEENERTNEGNPLNPASCVPPHLDGFKLFEGTDEGSVSREHLFLGFYT